MNTNTNPKPPNYPIRLPTILPWPMKIYIGGGCFPANVRKLWLMYFFYSTRSIEVACCCHGQKVQISSIHWILFFFYTSTTILYQAGCLAGRLLQGLLVKLILVCYMGLYVSAVHSAVMTFFFSFISQISIILFHLALFVISLFHLWEIGLR